MSDWTVPHRAFFGALGALEESHPDWAATSAGLVVLRYVDHWLQEGGAATDSWSLRAVREAVEAVDCRSPVRAILSGVVETLASGRGGARQIAPQLMAYGRALDFSGRWELAADVYRSMIAHLPERDDVDLVIDANMRLAYCTRMLGDLDGAAMAYARGGGLASVTGDLPKTLRAQIGRAKIALARGNLPMAERDLDAVIAQAAAQQLPEVRAVALHDRSTVAYARGDFERAVRFGYEALEGLTLPSARDRVIGDIAAAFLRLGMRAAARDAYLVVAATADEQFARWNARLNLMDVEAADGCEPRFEQHRRAIESQSLPPELRADFHRYAGLGYLQFGRRDAAHRELETSLTIAKRHGYHQLTFLAEEALASMTRAVPVPAASRTVETLVDVAEAMVGLREAAAGELAAAAIG